MVRVNEFGQPIDIALPDWKPRALPKPVTLIGRTCRLEPLNTKHADDLFAAYSHDDGSLWTYLDFGPFQNVDELRQFIEDEIASGGVYFAIVNLKTNNSVGIIALKRADPMHGTVEVGRGAFSPLLKQSIPSTEVRYLLMTYVFDQLQYRRLERTSKDLNEPSIKTALRLGYTFEGVLRNVRVEKGRSANRCCFSIIDKEWPTIKEAFQLWLAPQNFDENGRQIRKLEDIRKSVERNIHGVPSAL